MAKSRKKMTDCARFEVIICKRTDPTEEEMAFLRCHSRVCPFGIHTVEALQRHLERMRNPEIYIRDLIRRLEDAELKSSKQ